MQLKPGIKTTEFAITVGLFLLGLAAYVVASLQGAEGVESVIGLIVSALSALGYAVPRAKVKQRQLEAEATKAIEAAKVNPS